MDLNHDHLAFYATTLIAEDADIKAVFELCRKRRAGATLEARELQKRLLFTRRKAIAALKTLESYGFGRFWNGRHNHESRLEWYISPGSLLPREEIPSKQQIPAVAEIGLEPLIKEQKLAMAKLLGVDPSQVELTIRV